MKKSLVKDRSYRHALKMIRVAYGRREKQEFDFTRQAPLLNAVTI